MNLLVETESQLISALEQESESMNIPQNYRDLINKMLDATKKIAEKAQSSEKRAESLLLQYNKWTKTAESNYRYVEEMYKEEHRANLDRQEEIISLLSKNKCLEEEQEAKYQKLVQDLNQLKIASTEKLKQLEEDFKSRSTRQALGRKNIEEKLYQKDTEVNELKKKVVELEQKLVKSDNNAKRMETDNAQLKMLLGYWAQQNPQLAQQLNQQQQQPRPPHYQ